jgi:ATP adenylyltransferase
MVAPYRHVADLSALTDAERAEWIDLTIRAKERLVAVMHPEGFNLGMNLGGAAGAGLEDHLHQHLVPRWHGDTNFMPVLADSRVVPEALEATAALLRKEWRAE